MMRFKNMLKCFSKTEVQEDERFSLAPMREREELLSERSELSNSGEGYISCAERTEKVFSPFTSHFSQLCTPHPSPLPQGAREQFSCAEHTVTVFSSFTSHFSQLCTPHPSPLPQGAREQLSCAKHTEKNLLSNRPIVLTTSKKAAFTLAEVLITLGIIGVVAAVTMPVLIQKAEEKIVVNKVIKTYSILTNAYSSLLAEYGPPNTWEGISKSENINNFNNDLVVANYFAKQLKLSNICNVFSLKCHHNYTIKYGGLVPGSLDPASSSAHIWGYAGILNDMTVSFYMRSSSCNGWDDFSWDSVNKNPNSPYYHACGGIYVDINGTRSPNVHGRDLFQFIFTDRKIVPLGTPPTPYYSLKNSCNGTRKSSWDGSVNGSFCAAWVVINKNMDYLRKEVKW